MNKQLKSYRLSFRFKVLTTVKLDKMNNNAVTSQCLELDRELDIKTELADDLTNNAGTM